MKKSFPEYHQQDEESIKNLWDNALFIFDTNVLLNLYRYSDDTSDKFIQVISDLGARTWIPYQVGFEFYKNRLVVISDQKKNYQEFEKKIFDLLAEVDSQNRNPFFSDSLCKKLEDIKTDISTETEEKLNKFENSLKNDVLLDKINTAFENKVGVEPTPEELKKIYTEGDQRYKDKIPPGYQDSKKDGNAKYGDLVVWKEMIKKAKDSKQDVIFISDDRKDDWWLEHQGKTISPRPELLKEFRQITGQNCHFYQPFQFLEYSVVHLGSTINKEVLDEVKNHISDKKDEDVFHIELTVEGNYSDYDIFTEELERAGYNLYFETGAFDSYGEFTCIISIPKIYDLIRRFKHKYINNLKMYNLSLIACIMPE